MAMAHPGVNWVRQKEVFVKIRKTCILTIALLFSIALVAQMPGSEKQGCSLRTMEGS